MGYFLLRWTYLKDVDFCCLATNTKPDENAINKFFDVEYYTVPRRARLM